MLKRILVALAALLILAVGLAAGGLMWAHSAIRRERAPLPTADAVAASATNDGPVRVSYINTASQTMPRSGVLDAKLDPKPSDPYVMSHPSFVLEWADGRLLLVDVGMTREGAASFGRPIELVSGGQPIQAIGSVGERLGAAAKRIQATVFTHLHTDHVGGMPELCKAIGHPVRVFQTAAQAQRPNYTTRSGLDLLHKSSCVQLQELDGNALQPLPGFPGVFVIAAGGHTPGSQLIVAHIHGEQRPRTIVFVGDIVNNIDGVTYNVPKPYLYRLLVVPEDDERTDELRRYLRDLRDRHGALLLPAHDQRNIEASGIPAWP